MLRNLCSPNSEIQKTENINVKEATGAMICSNDLLEILLLNAIELNSVKSKASVHTMTCNGSIHALIAIILF